MAKKKCAVKLTLRTDNPRWVVSCRNDEGHEGDHRATDSVLADDGIMNRFTDVTIGWKKD